MHLNAVRHGVWSASPVVTGMEREDEWKEHLAGILASLAPTDHFEECLTERIALLLWRLRRVMAFETETLVNDLGKVDDEWDFHKLTNDMVATLKVYRAAADRTPKEVWIERRRSSLIIPEGKTLERVTRYEAHLQRQLLQTMHELEALQARKMGQTTPLARLDVQGGVGV